MVSLGELQKDAVAEMFNLGMGQSAAALSQMVGQEVELSVPKVNLKSREEAIAHFEATAGSEIAAVREEFNGAFWGSALLVFPEQKSLNLVRALLRDDLPLAELTGMEEEVLAEVGNVILNACLGSFGNYFGEEIRTGLPRFVRGSSSEIVLAADGGGCVEHSVLLVRVDFTVGSRDINGHVLLLIDVDSLEALLSKVERCFASL